MTKIAAFILFLATTTFAGASDKLFCTPAWTGSITKRFGDFEIRIFPLAGHQECRVRIRDHDKKTVFTETNWGFAVALVGQDVNDDGFPDLVLEGYSGGAHCCWTYYIVSLAGKPGLIRRFDNDRPASFEPDKTGRIEIKALDGAFDYFDFLSHAETVFPSVYLRLEGDKFLDVSHNHLTEYDRQIQAARKQLTPQSIEYFRSATTREEIANSPNRELARPILTIVLAYLYSGRKTKAQQEFQKMWPVFDQDVEWKMILETRKQGVLSYTRGTGH